MSLLKILQILYTTVRLTDYTHPDQRLRWVWWRQELTAVSLVRPPLFLAKACIPITLIISLNAGYIPDSMTMSMRLMRSRCHATVISMILAGGWVLKK
jgi:hypothetical protein